MSQTIRASCDLFSNPTHEICIIRSKERAIKKINILPSSVAYNGRYSAFNVSDNCRKFLIIDANVRP